MGDVKRTKLLIIGSGPAGYTAAVYGARAMLNPVLVEGLQPGGQLTITTDVENWPGETAIMGPELMAKLRAQAEHVGTEIISDIVASVDFSKRPFVAVADSGLVIEAETVVIATGASARWLGLPNETRLRGKGVSACATCDGFFFRNKHVAVVGGGNTAVEEAMFLTNFASKVTLIHRRGELRADKTNQARLFANPKVEMVWNATVSDVRGEDGVSAIELTDTQTGAVRALDVDGLFVAIGHDPATQIFKGQLRMDEEGYILVEPGTPRTDVPGVFAAGDVTDKLYRQAVTAAGMGCMAALEAERFLAHGAAHETREAA
ncbi:thioredoxin-disulfide reductase [Sandaracinobacter sp. RS1-74]|uniref:thioredoxin-disulfide reductase n=1 Tax=Sandaracinobacteroides sayramensis TaxID=2913411 RepID=UPI001ED9E68D|nr:thioredoxin-disulfide reductase [Sandaracinobacteroides sayramensis]MCG2841540.1 thioredoxin-disulfide reductase [Sandaracinobacteroides sayramensis]